MNVKVQARENHHPETHQQRGKGRSQDAAKIHDPLANHAGGNRGIHAGRARLSSSLAAGHGVVNPDQRLSMPQCARNRIHQLRKVTAAPVGIVCALLDEGVDPAQLFIHVQTLVVDLFIRVPVKPLFPEGVNDAHVGTVGDDKPHPGIHQQEATAEHRQPFQH